MACDGLFNMMLVFWGFVFWAKCAWGRVRKKGKVCVFV